MDTRDSDLRRFTERTRAADPPIVDAQQILNRCGGIVELTAMYGRLIALVATRMSAEIVPIYAARSTGLPRLPRLPLPTSVAELAPWATPRLGVGPGHGSLTLPGLVHAHGHSQDACPRDRNRHCSRVSPAGGWFPHWVDLPVDLPVKGVVDHATVPILSDRPAKSVEPILVRGEGHARP